MDQRQLRRELEQARAEAGRAMRRLDGILSRLGGDSRREPRGAAVGVAGHSPSYTEPRLRRALAGLPRGPR